MAQAVMTCTSLHIDADCSSMLCGRWRNWPDTLLARQQRLPRTIAEISSGWAQMAGLSSQQGLRRKGIDRRLRGITLSRVAVQEAVQGGSGCGRGE